MKTAPRRAPTGGTRGCRVARAPAVSAAGPARSAEDRRRSIPVRKPRAVLHRESFFWEEDDGERLESVEWLPSSMTLEVRFAAGRSYVLPLDQVPGIVPAEVRGAVVDDLRHGIVLKLGGGRKVDFASDLVLHRCDIEYRKWYEERFPPVNEPARERVGRRVREIRLRRGISLAELAAIARLTRGNASRLESGRHDPRLATLVRVARALGVTVADLVSA